MISEIKSSPLLSYDGLLPVIESEDQPARRCWVIFPPEHSRYELRPETSHRRSNAGMNAMVEAISSGHDDLWCLGFDFLLMDDTQCGNVYDGTPCYGPETRASSNDNWHRADYLEWFCSQHPKVTFNFVFGRKGDYLRLKPIMAPNTKGWTYDDFEKEVLSDHPV